MSDLHAPRLPLIGREKERLIVRRLLGNTSTAIIYIEGGAGIGKTMLLEEVSRIAQETDVICPSIVDFYDTRMHSHQGLEAAIADSLDTKRVYFGDYWRLRYANPQGDHWRQFLSSYSEIARHARIVLRFDTAERLEYERESDEIRIDCEATEVDAPSWRLLLNRIAELQNTVILIAARPTPNGLLRDRLKDKYGDQVTILDLSTFSLEETEQYFLATGVGRQVAQAAPEIIRRMHQLAGGRPILISLCLDWLQRGMWDRYTLEEIQAPEFERVLVEQIRNLSTPLDKAVLYASLCRKGCKAELLAELMQISFFEAEDLVANLQSLSFVKLPRFEGSRMFFLHDEMYDLVEKYIWVADWPDYSEQMRLNGVIISWYDKWIDSLHQKTRDPDLQNERAHIHREKQLLLTERLYYQLDLDPRTGYREYSHLAEQAIGARELEWDVWLRDELLAFRAHRRLRWETLEQRRIQKTEYDARRLWVNRYIAQGRYEKAVEIAEKLLARPSQTEEPALYRIGLQISQGTAQAYLGGPSVEVAERNLNAGIEAIVVQFGTENDRWLPQYLLGTAHLYKGLAVRSARPLVQAQHEYEKAIAHFRRLRYSPGLAEALNNLAYIRARQGKLKQALAACNEALLIRQGQGDQYAIGLSLNTKGIIEERLDRPITAIVDSEGALRIFSEIGNERGAILAAINLGRAYRRKGRSRDWRRQDADFEAGEMHLHSALQRQRGQGKDAEVYYKIQAYNELGCLYRDWAATLYEKDPNDQKVASYLLDAESNLKQALQLAEGQGKSHPLDASQYVDSLEDLARVYLFWMRADAVNKATWFQKTDALLAEAESLVISQIEQLDELRLFLGKIYFQRARQAQELGDNSKSAQYYALAAGYAESHSIDAPELEKIVSEASSWLGRLDPSEVKSDINVMREALESHQLPGNRLWEWIDGVVRPLLGVGWDEETVDG